MDLLDDELDLKKERTNIPNISIDKNNNAYEELFSFSLDLENEIKTDDKKPPANIGITSILAESERLSFDEFFRYFDKKYLSPLINDELSLFTNDIVLLQEKLLEGKHINDAEKNIVFQKINNLGNLTKDDIRIIKMDDKEFYEAIGNYRVNSLQDLDSLSTILNNREHKTNYVYEMINRVYSFSILIAGIKNSISDIEKNRHF